MKRYILFVALLVPVYLVYLFIQQIPTGVTHDQTSDLMKKLEEDVNLELVFKEQGVQFKELKMNPLFRIYIHLDKATPTIPTEIDSFFYKNKKMAYGHPVFLYLCSPSTELSKKYNEQVFEPYLEKCYFKLSFYFPNL